MTRENRVVYRHFMAMLIFLSGLACFQAQALNEPVLKPDGSPRISNASGRQAQDPPQDQAKRDAALAAYQQADQLHKEGSAASLKKALEKYYEALLLYRGVAARQSEGFILNRIGLVYDALGEKQKALDYYSQALPISVEVGNRGGEAETLSSIGKVYDDLGEKQKALDYYNQALPLRRAVDNPGGEGVTLTSIGKVYSSLGENEKALDYYNQALPRWRVAGDRAGEAATLVGIGAVYNSLGEKQKALAYFNQALVLARSVGDRANEAITLSNIGMLYSALGEKQKALDYYNQTLPLMRTVGYLAGEATTLSNMGLLYSALGEKQKALGYFNQALPLTRAVGDRAGEATTLTNVGSVYIALGEKQKALDYFNQALPLFRAVGGRDGEAAALNNIGLVYESLGEKQKALDYYNQALPLTRAVGNRAGEAATLNNMGLLNGALGERQKALDHFNSSLALFRAVGDRDGEANTLHNLMHMWRDNSIAFAIFYGKQAVNTLQQLRTNISGLDTETRKTFLHSKEGTYRLLAHLLISGGRLPEAQQVLGLLKEQEYFDFVRRDPSVSALLQRSDLTAEEVAAVTRYDKIADQITKLAGEFNALKASGTSPGDMRYQSLKTDIEAANRTFQVTLRQLADEFAKEPEKGKGIVKVLQENKGLQSDLKKWGRGTVSLYTVVGDETYHAILTTPTLQVAREAAPKIKAADLNKLVLAFREAVQDPKVDPRPLGQQLYKILIAPVEKDLEAAGAKTIIWSLDGTLRYLPIAALHDGKQYFVERYQNVIITLASRTRLNDPPGRKWTGLGLGVSKGVIKDWGTFRPLPAVPAELHSIIREAKQKQPMAGVLPGRVLLDETFTEQSMERALGEGRYPLVHIASHFMFKPGNETNSFLLLGDGNRLTVDKIRVSASPFFDGVELLTLSACDTATGGGSNGKEVEGFAVLAQEQGAQAVLATLWPVADESTKLLMQKFYQYHAAKPGTEKVAALRQAQLALLRPQTGGAADASRSNVTSAGNTGSTPAFTPDPKAPYAHPYFWAPFILLGNWR